MTNTNLQTNIGWLFYKDYYRYLYNNAYQNFKNKNRKLFNTVFDKQIIEQTGNPEHQLKLTTTYPGLLIGSGYSHESGQKNEDELKIGFFFDHTSGLPCLPGSSVKGVLRSAFPNKKKIEKLKTKKKKETDEEKIKRIEQKIGIELSKEKYIRSIITNIDKNNNVDIFELKDNIFEAPENTSIYNRDIFFDAFPISDNGKLLGNDYITPHKDPLKNPIPLQFMKVMPQVEFQFNFKLTDNIIPAIVKLELFKQILLDLGIGAKTNVGYGQFTDEPAKKNNEKNTESDDSDYNPDKTKSNQPQSKFEESFHFSVIGHLTKESIFKGTITKIDQNYVYVDFIVNNITCQIRKQNKVIRDSNNKKLIDTDVVKVLDKVNITVKNDYSNTLNLNCQISLLAK